jgi:indole-3-glycerol phosphate synthase
LQLGLEPLVETHNGAEILAVKALKLRMLGINNRNIMQLEMDDGGVGNTEKLTGLVEPGVLIISESSLLSLQDVKRAAAAGAHAVLIGTAILKADDPVKMYRTLSEIEEKSHDEG